MYDSRRSRRMLQVGVAAAIVGILAEFYVRPIVSKGVK
jgi:hypothetical protein